MYDVIDGDGDAVIPCQVSPVVFGEFTKQLNIGLREIHLFVTLSFDFIFYGGRIGR